MKNNIANIFFEYLVYELEELSDKQLELEVTMQNLYRMVYDLRYTEDFNVNRIVPFHMREPKPYPKFYTKDDIENLPISNELKVFMKTILTYEKYCAVVRNKIKKLKYFSNFKKLTYYTIMQLTFINLSKVILKGFSLNLGYGLGSLSLIFARPKDGQIVDWFKSQEKKADIIERGGIPYYKYDEEIILSQGLEYEGEEWLTMKPCDSKLYIRWSKNRKSFYPKVDYRTYKHSPVVNITSDNRTVSDFYTKSEFYIMNTNKLDLLRKAYILMTLDPTYYLKFRNMEEEKKNYLLTVNKV